MTQPTISAERIEEMLAGLDGVTPGPWDVKTQEDWDAGFDFFGGLNGAFTFPVDGEPLDVAHIARCDPDTMREVLTLALSALRTQAQGSEAVAFTTQRMLDAMREPDTIVGSIWPSASKDVPIPLYASPPVQAQPQVTEHIEYLERAETRLREFALSVDAGEAQGGAREWDRRIWASFAELRDALATPPAPVDGGVTGALSGIIAAWEATKPGDTTRTEIQRWLIEDMKPAIDYARAALTASRAAVSQDETP